MTDSQRKFVRELRETYNSVLTERIPDDLRQLVERLK
jgi:hypothetical protein